MEGENKQKKNQTIKSVKGSQLSNACVCELSVREREDLLWTNNGGDDKKDCMYNMCRGVRNPEMLKNSISKEGRKEWKHKSRRRRMMTSERK